MELDLDAPQYGHAAATPEHLLIKNQLATKENVDLFEACLCGSLADAKDAIERGGKANFFFRPEDSKNALHVASEGGHLEIVEELLRNGAVADCRVASTRDTALLLATIAGHEEIVKTLLKASAKVNTCNI